MFNNKTRKYDSFPEVKGTIPIVFDNNLNILDESYQACKKYFKDADLARAVIYNLSKALIDIDEKYWLMVQEKYVN